jgi:hypothetical protein
MQISEAEMNSALINELCSGRMLMETQQKFRERACAQEAFEARGHKSIKGLGKMIASIPSHEYFLIREKYGHDCWNDRGFVRDFQKLEPTMAANKI